MLFLLFPVERRGRVTPDKEKEKNAVVVAVVGQFIVKAYMCLASSPKLEREHWIRDGVGVPFFPPTLVSRVRMSDSTVPAAHMKSWALS